MSPDLVDEAILAVISEAAAALEPPTNAKFNFIAKRIKALVKAERLESAGDLDRWMFSEIRLRQRNVSKAPAEARRLRETTEQGT